MKEEYIGKAVSGEEHSSFSKGPPCKMIYIKSGFKNSSILQDDGRK